MVISIVLVFVFLSCFCEELKVHTTRCTCP